MKIVFSGPQAVKTGKEILCITERAVFSLNTQGLVLREVAPGVDIDKDILSHMEFKPQVPDSVDIMPECLFYKDMKHLKEYIDNILKEAGLL